MILAPLSLLFIFKALLDFLYFSRLSKPVNLATTSSKFERRRLSSSYFSVVVSISLVLFMLGMVGLILLQAQKLGQYVKENIAYHIFFLTRCHYSYLIQNSSIQPADETSKTANLHWAVFWFCINYS